MAGRLIDADKLKAHYAWWKGGSREMTMDEAKSDFDTIIDLQPTVEVEPIEVRATYEQKAYSKGLADGYAMCLMDFNKDEPIVRCKDCKCHGTCRYEQHLGLDGYCSKAERMDEVKNG